MKISAALSAVRGVRDAVFLSRSGSRRLPLAYAAAGAALVGVLLGMLRAPPEPALLAAWSAGLAAAFWAALERRPGHWFFWAFYPWLLAALVALPLGGWLACGRLTDGGGADPGAFAAGALLAVAAGGAFAGFCSLCFDLSGLPLTALESLGRRISEGGPRWLLTGGVLSSWFIRSRWGFIALVIATLGRALARWRKSRGTQRI